MRAACLVLALFVAACGGGGGGSATNTPPPPPPPPVTPTPLQWSVTGAAVIKVRVATAGTTVMIERLQPIIPAGGPDRSLQFFDANGAMTGRYDAPAGFSIVDFAQHASGDATAALATATTVSLVRVSRTAATRDTTPIIDPLAETDRFYDEGGLHDDHSLLPVFTRDAVALAPIADSVVVALRTGRNATVAYRYDRSSLGGYTGRWRTLVEPGVSVFGVGITSGTFDTFSALENSMHVWLDTDEAGHVAVAVPSTTVGARVFAAHADYFGQSVGAAQEGALVTRLDENGARLGTAIVDTGRPSELHGLRIGAGEALVVGRVFTERRADGGGWDAYAGHVSLASGALSGFRTVDVDRGDILFDIAPLGDGRWIAVGTTGYTQNPDGASVSEPAPALIAVLDGDSAVRARIALPDAPRINEGRSVVPVGTHWIVGGMSNGPGTHSGDGNPAAIVADGFVREVSIP